MNRDDIYAMTQKRLRKELKQLEKSDDDTIYLRPIKVGEVRRSVADSSGSGPLL